MAKFELRIQARALRKKGVSVKEIAEKLKISRSTASIWVRDIILNIGQLEKLRKNVIVGAERGRLLGALVQKRRRIEFIASQEEQGKLIVGTTNDREFMMAGLALYWAEGSKKDGRVQLCNSDPRIINLFINWLDKFFGVPKDRLTATVGINEIHRDREIIVKKYWCNITELPSEQFRKTSFKRAMNKKVYENMNEHFGTLSINVLKPGQIYYKILGMIKGLALLSG